MSLYVAATRKDDGKTVVSLGLLHEIIKRIPKTCYMKPVGQDYRLIDDQKIDKDAVLMKDAFGLESSLVDMSPITIPKGFTEQYILHGSRNELEEKLTAAYRKLSGEYQFVIVEGTGHAGVGSVIDLSNSRVAKLLGLKCVIVSQGGIGKTVDQVMLNYEKFDKDGVEVLGVIVNKVLPSKYEKVKELVTLSLERHGVKALGFIPYVNHLGLPTFRELLRHLDSTLVCGENYADNAIESMVLGDLAEKRFTDYLKGPTLLIIPGDREELLVMLTTNGQRLGISEKFRIAGIITTYGIAPSGKVVEIVKEQKIPMAVTCEDSFSVVNKLSRMTYKVTSRDKLKIQTAQETVGKYVDTDALLGLLK